jgi:signal transduction histidine kinase
MRGLSQLLAGFDLTDAERRRVASLLEAEAGKLQSMVTALLDIERLPLRDFETSSVMTDLGDLVAARVDFLRASADRPLFMSADPGVLVRADPALIERVVDNLVGNAIKYTAAPVSVSVRQRGENAVLEVEDRGEGISEVERERIFDRFFRGSTARGTQGLGLGLTLVAEIARWHGGTVSLESVEGSGSRFGVVLPRGNL